MKTSLGKEGNKRYVTTKMRKQRTTASQQLLILLTRQQITPPTNVGDSNRVGFLTTLLEEYERCRMSITPALLFMTTAQWCQYRDCDPHTEYNIEAK